MRTMLYGVHIFIVAKFWQIHSSLLSLMIFPLYDFSALDINI